MTIKLVAKSDLKFENGYIFDKDNNIVSICNVPNLIAELNLIEEVNQRIQWAKNNPGIKDEDNSFKFQSAFPKKNYHLNMPDTPLHDAKVEESLKFIEETDAINNVEEVNNWMDIHANLLNWIDAENTFIAPITVGIPERFDLLTLGNPLELTVDKIQDVISAACTCELI